MIARTILCCLLLAFLCPSSLLADDEKADQGRKPSKSSSTNWRNGSRHKPVHKPSSHNETCHHKPSSSSTSSSSEKPAPFRFDQKRIYPGSTIHPFTFGAAGTYALQSFYFYAQAQTVLDVFDCYCGGDMFRVYDNGVWLDDAIYNCQYAFGTCNYFGGSAEECQAAEEGFCRFDGPVSLTPGFHNITIYVLTNFYQDGVAYLTLDYPTGK